MDKKNKYKYIYFDRNFIRKLAKILRRTFTETIRLAYKLWNDANVYKQTIRCWTFNIERSSYVPIKEF